MSYKLSFSINDAQVIDENPQSNFAVLKLDFFASGRNLHEMYVSEETLLRTAESIKNCPLVWKYDARLDDIYTHDKDEVPCGFVPENSPVESRKLEDGRTMLSVVAYVWKKYTGELLSIFKRDKGKKPVSVEMSVFDRKLLGNGLLELLDFKYEGITILGSYVTPAIPLANATVVSFSKMEEEYWQDYKKEFTTPLWGVKKSEKEMAMDENTEVVENAVDQVPSDTETTPNTEEVVTDVQNAVENVITEETPVVVENAAEEKEEEKEEVAEEEKETPEEEKKEKFCFPEKMSLEMMEKLFAEDTEEEMSLAKAEMCKGKDFANPTVIMSGMFAKICKMAEALAQMAAANQVYMQENEELKKFKADQDKLQKEFAVKKFIEKLSEKVILPDTVKDEMVKEAESFTLANLNEWETSCKAKSFDFALRETDKSDVVPIGLIYTAENIKKSDDLWASN